MPRTERYDQSEALARRYSEMSDSELLDLRADFDDLTDNAQEALRQELSHRKLWSTTPAIPTAPQVRDAEPEDDPPDGPAFNLELGGESICTCDSLEQADLVCYALGLQKIEAAVYRPQEKYAQPLPQVRVAPSDVERAREILAQGISDQVIREFESQPAPDDFVEPACPKCGAPDALLESVDPVNQWLCETCGTRWQDEVREA
jgi:hypothetical protein